MGYHPRVVNPNPVGIVTNLNDEDGFVQPGQEIVLTAQVTNRTTGFSDGTLQIAVPPALGGGTRTAAISLIPDEVVSSEFTLTVDPAATGDVVTIDSTAQVQRVFPPDTQSEVVQASTDLGSVFAPIVSVMIAPDPRPDHYQISGRTNQNAGFAINQGVWTRKVNFQQPSQGAQLLGKDTNTFPPGTRNHNVACANNGRCLAVWRANPNSSGPRIPQFVIGMQMVGQDGTLQTRHVLTLPGTSVEANPQPVVATNGDEFLVAWGNIDRTSNRNGLWIQRVRNDGQLIGGQTRILANDSAEQWSAADIVYAEHENRYHLAFIRSTVGPISILPLDATNPTNPATVGPIANLGSGGVPQLAYDPQSGRLMLVFIQPTGLGGTNPQVFARFVTRKIPPGRHHSLWAPAA
ncbi:MAG: hypothetical protein HC893_05425 [Chloroflexaceae bacterium]|nr:hypothetical protein [Chloroflexaceae bacterium]